MVGYMVAAIPDLFPSSYLFPLPLTVSDSSSGTPSFNWSPAAAEASYGSGRLVCSTDSRCALPGVRVESWVVGKLGSMSCLEYRYRLDLL